MKTIVHFFALFLACICLSACEENSNFDPTPRMDPDISKTWVIEKVMIKTPEIDFKEDYVTDYSSWKLNLKQTGAWVYHDEKGDKEQGIWYYDSDQDFMNASELILEHGTGTYISYRYSIVDKNPDNLIIEIQKSNPLWYTMPLYRYYLIPGEN